MPEKMSSIEKVIGKGLSEEEKVLIAYQFKEKFDNQKFEELRGLEREKTAEELEIISLANDKTNKLLEEFGLKKFDVPAKNIHVVSKEKWKRGDAAFFDGERQAVVTCAEDWKILFAKNIFHEMLHFKSGTALLVKEKKKRVFVVKSRSGFQIYEKTGGKAYFINLDEAITEELTKRLTIDLEGSPLFQDEISRMKKLYREYPQLITEDMLVLEVSPPDDRGETQYKYKRWDFSYKRERNILNTLIDKLYEKNKDEFKYREEVFNLFAKAMLEGNIIEVGYLVDKTFGKGTMRTIGELEDDITAQENYVKLL